MTKNKLPPIHPGEILNEEFLQPYGLIDNANRGDTFVGACPCGRPRAPASGCPYKVPCLSALSISQYRLAKEIGVPARRINEIVHGKRSITPDTALLLSRYFGLSKRF